MLSLLHLVLVVFEMPSDDGGALYKVHSLKGHLTSSASCLSSCSNTSLSNLSSVLIAINTSNLYSSVSHTGHSAVISGYYGNYNNILTR